MRPEGGARTSASGDSIHYETDMHVFWMEGGEICPHPGIVFRVRAGTPPNFGTNCNVLPGTVIRAAPGIFHMMQRAHRVDARTTASFGTNCYVFGCCEKIRGSGISAMVGIAR